MNTLRILLSLAALALVTAPLSGQEPSVLTGTVVEAVSGGVVADAILRIEGTNASAVSDAQGRFVLRGLPVGPHTLALRHPGFGEHQMQVTVSRPGEQFTVVVRVSSAGIAVELVDAAPAPSGDPGAANLFPVSVTDELTTPVASGPAVATGTVVYREKIREFAGSSRNVGDLIRRVVPTLQVRESDATASIAGSDLCLEFRGTTARSFNVGAGDACHHPQVYLDGVQLADPAAAYAISSFESLQWIQAIPPGQVGAQFGSSTYGVLLIATTQGAGRMAAMTTGLVRSRRTTFDWDQDPNGHNFFKTFLGAAAGNAAGLALGLAAGRQCVYVEEPTKEIATSCSNAGVAGVGLAAFALPAMGSALGAHFGGSTSVSVGRWIPALLGASMAIFPGYAFSLTTVGGGVAATNGAGAAFLLVGTPLFTTLADRLYRTLRNP
jgi:hypothetical protein